MNHIFQRAISDSDLASGIAMVMLFWIVMYIKPLRRLFVELFFVGANQREERRQMEFNPDQACGSARYATTKDLKKAGYLQDTNGIRLGFTDDGRKIFYNGFGHLLLVAAARTGKAFTVLVAAILTLGRRSLVVFDPKAELTCITAFARKRFGQVIVLNPFGIWLDRMTGLLQGHLNPMDMLDPTLSSFHAMCDKLTDSFRPRAENLSDPHWWDTAAIAISGTIAALKKYGQPEDRNLVAMRSVITGANGTSFFEFARECMKLPDPFIKQKLSRFAALGAEESKELAGVLSTMDTQTSWLGNEAIAAIMKDSNFRFRDLKRNPGGTIYFCLPLNTLDVSFQFFATGLMCMLTDLLDEGIKGPSVLAIVDEAAQIPWFKAWQDAWGMAAGAAGLQIWAVYQDVNQIMNQMGKSAWSIIQNSGVTMWFSARDPETRETVSKLAGTAEVFTQSMSVTRDERSRRPSVNRSMSQTSRPLLHPDEVGFGLAQDEMLIFGENLPGVVRAKRRPYLKEFKGQYRPNPYVANK